MSAGYEDAVRALRRVFDTCGIMHGGMIVERFGGSAVIRAMTSDQFNDFCLACDNAVYKFQNTNLGSLFDLVRSTRGGYVGRVNYSEVMHIRAVYHSMRHTIERHGKDAEVSRLAMDGWLATCNDIVDHHIRRKPLTRGAA